MVRYQPRNKWRRSNSEKPRHLIIRKFNTIHCYFTGTIIWTSSNPKISINLRYPNRNINNNKTVLKTNNSETVSHPVLRVFRNRYILNIWRWCLTRLDFWFNPESRLDMTPTQFEYKQQYLYLMGYGWTEAVTQPLIVSFHYQKHCKPESEVKYINKVCGQVKYGSS